MWSTEIQYVLSKACKNFDNFFLYFPYFFGIFDETKQGESEFASAVKILDFFDKRAKSYAYSTEGIPSFRKGTTQRRRQLGQSVPKLQHRSRDESSQ